MLESVPSVCLNPERWSSIRAMIGYFASGIVKKNAIVMMDFALEAQRLDDISSGKGVGRGGRPRHDPIITGSLAALPGTLIITSGARSESRFPHCVPIINGSLLSQVPVIFFTVERLRLIELPTEIEAAQESSQTASA